MILDGKAIAEDMYVDLAPCYAMLGTCVRLGIVVVGNDPVIESFVRIKSRSAARLGVDVVRVNLSDKVQTTEVIAEIETLSRVANGIIVQLPLPVPIDTNAVLSAIPPEKDVDAINPRIADEDRRVRAPVALAVVELLARGSVDPRDKRVIVAGSGRLVGAPAASLLASLGARVSFFTRTEGSIDDLKNADIIVLGMGDPAFIKPEHLKEGVALIDAATSEQAGKVVGDADPACASKTSLFTPVPGGVGPVAVAMIFKNLLVLAQCAS